MGSNPSPQNHLYQAVPTNKYYLTNLQPKGRLAQSHTRWMIPTSPSSTLDSIEKNIRAWHKTTNHNSAHNTIITMTKWGKMEFLRTGFDAEYCIFSKLSWK